MIFLLSPAHVHTPTQTIHNNNALRSTVKKRKKKSPGNRFDFWLFGERKEKRGREGERDRGWRSKANY